MAKYWTNVGILLGRMIRAEMKRSLMSKRPCSRFFSIVLVNKIVQIHPWGKLTLSLATLPLEPSCIWLGRMRCLWSFLVITLPDTKNRNILPVANSLSWKEMDYLLSKHMVSWDFIICRSCPSYYHKSRRDLRPQNITSQLGIVLSTQLAENICTV